ncbi:Uncharacterised protein [Mycobacteroides abscessus]|nr:Uncharacterised protein [Mycobacteroides abscessus]
MLPSSTCLRQARSTFDRAKSMADPIAHTRTSGQYHQVKGSRHTYSAPDETTPRNAIVAETTSWVPVTSDAAATALRHG